jgi:hypothetical protein
MRNRGLGDPARNAIICLVLVVGSAASVLWGIAEMKDLGHETTASGAAIGVGLVIGILSFGMLFLFLKGIRVVGAMRRGENEIARWVVPATLFDAFRGQNKERNALGPAYSNDYKPPRRVPAEGVEIIFASDGVLIGGNYFPLVTTGMYRFAGSQILPGDPACIEFGTRMFAMTNLTVVMVHQHAGVIRMPIAPLAMADAEKVLAHFQKVERREIVVQPDVWRKRIRWGLIAFLVSVVIAAIGFGLEALDVETGMISLLMAVTGTIAAIGGLVLAFLGWVLHLKQHEKP